MLNDINLDRKTNVTCSLSYLEDENKSWYHRSGKCNHGY
jgi:hypothetical protein